jgi:hypothetical protein
MDKNTILLLFFSTCVPIGGYIAFQWWKMFDSADGERRLKQRVQGPFVPLGAEEIADDEARTQQ